MIHLVQYEAYDRIAGAVVTERFATDGYTTGKNDDPPHVHFEERVVNPGTYEQTVFDNGTTSGEARVGFGYIEIAIGDDGAGNDADRLAKQAVDGRPITIWALEDRSSPWSSKVLVFKGTMEQIEVSWTIATIRIKDRLDDLRKPIQPTVYLGTTTDGTKTDAEGTKDDLKDRPKPLAWGINRNAPGVLSNRWKLIVDFAANGCDFLEVRDKGVPLTKGTGYATFAALMAATVTGPSYAYCASTGQVRLGSSPAGAISADIVEGASGQRSAARVAQRILEKAGFVAGTDFSATDLNSLHGLNSADLGIWVGTDPANVLPLLTRVLDSVGGYVVPDATGLLRFGRVVIPAASTSYPVIDRTMILDGGSEKIERVATADDRNGVPAWKVTMRYAPSWLVQSETELDQTATSATTKAFVSKDMRTVSAENAAVKTINLRAAELTFDTLLANEADAFAEAQRRLAIYSAPRERYRVPVKAELADGITLGSAVTLKLPRFGLDAGKPFLVIGLDTRLPRRQGSGASAGIVVLDLFG